MIANRVVGDTYTSARASDFRNQDIMPAQILDVHVATIGACRANENRRPTAEKPIPNREAKRHKARYRSKLKQPCRDRHI
jgi:hypothetical protein